MELRGGVWTSQTHADDAEDIRRIARRIEAVTTDPQVRADAQHIARLARGLEDELR
jgi:hypothetical protein